MKNKYSLTLLAISVATTLIGALMISIWPYPLNIWGFIPFVFGGLMLFQGFKTPELSSNASSSSGTGTTSASRKVWLLTFFGRQVDAMSEGLTFLCDWLPIEVLGYVEVDTEQFNKEFPAKKRILCRVNEGGVWRDDGYVDLFIEMAFEPDTSSALSLWKFVNAGQRKGVLDIIEGIVTPVGVEVGSTHDNKWMETESEKLNNELKRKMIGLVRKKCGDEFDADDTDDLQGLGVKITKFNAWAKPKDKIIDVRDELLVERGQRISQKEDTETMNRRIKARVALYTKSGKDHQGNVVPGLPYAAALNRARREILEEQALADGKLQIIDNRGGINLANTGGKTT